MPLISAILPSFNYARYLKERIRSILGQTHADIELIYVDDASTDHSADVVRTFSEDSRLQIIEHKQNSGRVYQRWNEGAEAANGDWLWFAGADDSAHPALIERLLSRVVGRVDVGIIHNQLIRMDVEGRIIADKWYGDATIMERLSKDYVAAGFEEAPILTEGCYLMSASGMLIRKDAFRACGGFDMRLWGAADWDLYLRMLKHYDIGFVADPLSYYRIHSGAVTSSTKSTVRSIETLYTLASAFDWLRTDPRVSQDGVKIVERRVRAALFDVFADPAVSMPANLRFAVERINEIIPDKRLHKLLSKEIK